MYSLDEKNPFEKQDSKKEHQEGGPPNNNQTETKNFHRNPGTLNRAKVVLFSRIDRMWWEFQSDKKNVLFIPWGGLLPPRILRITHCKFSC